MNIAVVGAGVVGLAHAYWAAKAGHKVSVFERDTQAVGASIRNFGLIWPIGQEQGKYHDLAVTSRSAWLELSSLAGFWINPNGSLHLAYHQDEWEVINEYHENTQVKGKLLSATEVQGVTEYIKSDGLQGGLFSDTECTVNPRQAIPAIADYLKRELAVDIYYGVTVNHISMPTIATSSFETQADAVIICNGSDYRTLFPDLFSKAPLTKCKLQMMKGTSTNTQILGPTLCGGLTLTHYASFSQCPSLPNLISRIEQELSQFREFGIHVMLAQNNQGELIIGDSHEYGLDPSPFNSETIDRLILDYLNKFAQLSGLEITQRWHGVYAKLTNGNPYYRGQPAAGVQVVTGFGGAGMTLSFGVAKETVDGLD